MKTDDLRYGDIIEHVIDGAIPGGERFMVVRAEGEFIWAMNVTVEAEHSGPGWKYGAGHSVFTLDTGPGGQSFRVVERAVALADEGAYT